MILRDDNGKVLPEKINNRVNDFIDSLPKANWFNPSSDLKKKDVDKQVKFTLDCFWIKAKIEYRKLETATERASARDSARDSTWASAKASTRASTWASAKDSARDSTWASTWASTRASARVSAWDSTWASARDSTWDSAWDSAWASAELLIEDNEDFKEKYPNWAFKQLFKLWEMWLYPVWVLKETWTFVIYSKTIAKDLFQEEKEKWELPKAKDLFQEEKEKWELPNELNINGKIYLLKE